MQANREIPRGRLPIPTTQTRDLDGNILSEEPSERQPYQYRTGEIPSWEFEILIRAITIDEFQGCLVYHQAVQGKIY